MKFHVITLFPDLCKAYTDASILGRAQMKEKGKGAKHVGKKIEVKYYDIRTFAKNKHKKVDDRPYGGGPGMVMYAEPILRAWHKAVGRKVRAQSAIGEKTKNQKPKTKVKTLIMSPRGKKFDTKMAKDLAKKYDHIVLISGRYEGIDSRVLKILKACLPAGRAEEVSVGDYVLTGGELPALTIIDSVARQVPGVLGTFESLEEERVSSGEMYTRPEVLEYKKKKYKVPPVFLSGNHAEIERFKREQRNENI